MFGVWGLIVFPFMLVVTLLVALPLFFLLRRARWLEWWHALLAGAFCGLCFAAVNTSDLDRFVNSNNVYFIGLGALIGFAFWWIGIFRNRAFPFVRASIPKSVVLVVPLVAGGLLMHQALRLNFYQGRVLTVLKEPSPPSTVGEVAVRLSSGSTVQAQFGNTWPRSMVAGKCFHLMERWSTLEMRRVYELASPFGGGVDDC